MLSTWLFFTAFTSSMEAAHDLGVNDKLRGTISLEVQSTAVETPEWTIDLLVSMHSIVRENRRNETAFRISPEHINYPVAARWRVKGGDGGYDWALFARHQSEHDIDGNDPQLNRETISYEVYGVQWLHDSYAVDVGLYYDRGTRLDGRKQLWPFDYYLAGIRHQGRHSLNHAWYVAYATEWVAHRNEQTEIPYVDVSGYVDLGWSLPGETGRMNTFLRFERLSNYKYLGDTPQQMLMLGLEIAGGDIAPSQWF